MASSEQTEVEGKAVQKFLTDRKKEITLEEYPGCDFLSTAFERATDKEYICRDPRIHQIVRHSYFFYGSFRAVFRRWRIRNVAVVLGDNIDYLRLGLPGMCRNTFRTFNAAITDRSALLDDPLYENTEDIWWVRAWPSRKIATVVTADGTEQVLNAKEIVRRTGQGFTVTMTVELDFFFTPAEPGDEQTVVQLCEDGFRTPDTAVSPRGPVARVVDSVITDLYDHRKPRYRHGRDDDAPGCHLPRLQISPDAVLAQLADIGLPVPVASAATGKDKNHKETTTATEQKGRRTEDPTRDRPLPEDHVSIESTASAPETTEMPAAQQPRLENWKRRFYG